MEGKKLGSERISLDDMKAVEGLYLKFITEKKVFLSLRNRLIKSESNKSYRMGYKVEIKEPAERQIKKLDKSRAKEMLDQIEKLENNPDIHGKPLRGRLAGIWQLRSGKYRIWYTIEDDTVYVRAVKHKKDAEKEY